jgi:hypothetical protein
MPTTLQAGYKMLKPWLMPEHEQTFADAVAHICLNQYQKLPNTRKPSVNGTKREWTILAGIALVREMPEGHVPASKPKINQKYIAIDEKQYELTLVSLG